MAKKKDSGDGLPGGEGPPPEPKGERPAPSREPIPIPTPVPDGIDYFTKGNNSPREHR